MSAGTFGGQHHALEQFFSHAAGFFHRRRACSRRDIHEFIDPADVRNVWEPSRLDGRLSAVLPK